MTVHKISSKYLFSKIKQLKLKKMSAIQFLSQRVARNPTKSSDVVAEEARGISSYLQSSYSPWIPITTSSKSDPDHDAMYSYQMGYLNQPFDGREELLYDRMNSNGYKAQESYGGYEDGGYGAMQNSVAFSALGLISFLFFLKMIGDTINLLDGGLPVPIQGKRDSRSALNSSSSSLSAAADEMSRIGKIDWHAVSLIIGLLLDDRAEVCQTSHLLCMDNGRENDTFRHTTLRDTPMGQENQRFETSNLIANPSSNGHRDKICHPYLKTCHEKQRVDNEDLADK